MIKILPRLTNYRFGNDNESYYVYDPSYQCDYCLEGGITLWKEDWNGEIYRNGFQINSDGKLTPVNKQFSPVEIEKSEEGDYELLGFAD